MVETRHLRTAAPRDQVARTQWVRCSVSRAEPRSTHNTFHGYLRFLRPGQGNTPSSSRRPPQVSSSHRFRSDVGGGEPHLRARGEHRLAVSLESIEQFRVEQRGDLAVSGWEPQPAASDFLPNIARLSSAAAHYESDRTNRNVRFAAGGDRLRPQAVQEPKTAAGG